MTNTPLKFTKVQAGWYATEDGRYAAIKDGTSYVRVGDYNGTGIGAGCQDDGWSATFDPEGRLRVNLDAGESLDWKDTKADAIDYLQNHARYA